MAEPTKRWPMTVKGNTGAGGVSYNDLISETHRLQGQIKEHRKTIDALVDQFGQERDRRIELEELREIVSGDYYQDYGTDDLKAWLATHPPDDHHQGDDATSETVYLCQRMPDDPIDEPDYGGAFDGVTVSSDADPGL